MLQLHSSFSERRMTTMTSESSPPQPPLCHFFYQERRENRSASMDSLELSSLHSMNARYLVYCSLVICFRQEVRTFMLKVFTPSFSALSCSCLFFSYRLLAPTNQPYYYQVRMCAPSPFFLRRRRANHASPRGALEKDESSSFCLAPVRGLACIPGGRGGGEKSLPGKDLLCPCDVTLAHAPRSMPVVHSRMEQIDLCIESGQKRRRETLFTVPPPPPSIDCLFFFFPLLLNCCCCVEAVIWMEESRVR